MENKSTGLFGKFGENYLIGILLEEDFEVFKPEFDRGTDLVVKMGKKMFSFQIKTRNYSTDKDRHLIIKRKVLEEIDFVIYIIYNGRRDTHFLIIPSEEVMKWKGSGNREIGIHFPIKYNYNPKNPKVIFKYNGKEINLSKYLDGNGLKLIK